MSAIGPKRTFLFAPHMSAIGGKADMPLLHRKCLLMTQSGHSPKLGYALGTFGVRYHTALDFFRITGALRCKANNFFGYDFN